MRLPQEFQSAHVLMQSKMVQENSSWYLYAVPSKKKAQVQIFYFTSALKCCVQALLLLVLCHVRVFNDITAGL